MTALAAVEPTLAMGLEDLVPVVVTAATMVLLARRLDRRALLVAAALLAAGGTAKAGWKILYAATGDDHALLADALFPILAPGLAVAAWSLWRPGSAAWPPLALAAAVEAVALLVRSTGPLLVLTIVCSVAVTAWVGRACVRAARPAGAAFAVGQLGASMLLSRLAAVPNQTNTLQWIAQSVNTAGALALLAAAHLATEPAPARTAQEAIA